MANNRKETSTLEGIVHLFFAVAAWAMIIGLGYLTWQHGGLVWFAYCGVILLIGIFFEAASTRVAAEEISPAVYALHTDLRKLRRILEARDISTESSGKA